MSMHPIRVRFYVCAAVLASAALALPLHGQKEATDSGPKIPASVAEPGKAVGEFTVNGETAKLLYAYAISGPDNFDKTKTGYHVILSDVPWNPEDHNRNDAVTAGTLHYVELTIGAPDRIYGTMLFHRAFKVGTLSSAGSGHKFDVEKLGPDVIAGRAYLEAPRNSLHETFYYAATFRAKISKD